MNILHKGDRRLMRGWSMYDWANSVFSLTIATAVFPIYYENATANDRGNTVWLFGREYVNTALYSYVLAAAFLMAALLSPILSSIADYRRNKLVFMQASCYIGAAACAGLFFFTTAETATIGLAMFWLATVGFTSSLVFYNAYLPEIAPEHVQDKLSARGFSMGYVGSVLLLIFNLMLVQNAAAFGISDGLGARLSFVSVGLWWAGFAQIAFNRLRQFERSHPNYGEKKNSVGNIFGGYKQLRVVFNELKQQPKLQVFLISFFFYNMAVQTVMYVATLFGSKELKLETSSLILTVLIIQLVAIGGAFLFAHLSKAFGNIRGLMIAVVVWIGICIGAYFIRGEMDFFVVAFFVGMVMGGIQALSRSTYSKMLPETENHASYFSFYDVMEKMSIVLGTASYGLVEELTGSMRNSIVGLVVYFVVGLVGLAYIQVRWPARKRRTAAVVA
ncbi:MAG TPA: MFS transporter [Chitinophagales bacterium]|nr:MFS transporter [Chitinophagales bacterium]